MLAIMDMKKKDLFEIRANCLELYLTANKGFIAPLRVRRRKKGSLFFGRSKPEYY